MNHVWQHTTYPPAQSYILMAIADVVNDTHGNTFYMSVKNLAYKVKCSERSIQRALRQFEADGWLSLTATGNGKESNEHIFNFAGGKTKVTDCPKVTWVSPLTVDKSIAKVTNEVVKGDKKCVKGDKSEFIPITYTNNPKNPIKDRSNDFNSFWEIYPRKVNKVAALKAFLKALEKVSADYLIMSAQRLANDPTLEIAFCPHASTWLNGERWADESPSQGRINQPKGLATLEAMRSEQKAIA